MTIKEIRLTALIYRLTEEIEGALGCTDGDDIRNHCEESLKKAKSNLEKINNDNN